MAIGACGTMYAGASRSAAGTVDGVEQRRDQSSRSASAFVG